MFYITLAFVYHLLVYFLCFSSYSRLCAQPAEENYSNPNICFFHVLFKSTDFNSNCLKLMPSFSWFLFSLLHLIFGYRRVKGRTCMGLKWGNEINNDGDIVSICECLDQEVVKRYRHTLP